MRGRACSSVILAAGFLANLLVRAGGGLVLDPAAGVLGSLPLADFPCAAARGLEVDDALLGFAVGFRAGRRTFAWSLGDSDVAVRDSKSNTLQQFRP